MKKLLFLMVFVVVSAGLVVLNGCKKEDEPQTVGEQIDEGIRDLGKGVEKAGKEIQDQAEDTSDAVQDQSEQAADDLQSNAAIEQKVCPVMGGAIDPKVFVEYKGKKVYFCCAGCPDEFLKNPEMYVSKLPQFQE